MTALAPRTRRNARALWLMFLLLTVIGVSFRSRASNFTWTNTAGSTWLDFQAWSPNGVPGSADTATITNNGTYTIALDTSPSVQVLNLGATTGTQSISNAGFDFTIRSSGSVGTHGVLNLIGGSLTATNTSIRGLLTCAGVNLNGQITVVTNGTAFFAGAGTNILAAAFTNQATTFWTGGQINFNQGRIANQPGAFFEIQSDQAVGGFASNALSFVNAGTLRKSVTTGTSTISVPFTNSGTIIPAAGFLAVQGSVTLPNSSVIHFPTAGTNRGAQYGQFQVTGALRFGGTLSSSNVAIPNFPDSFRVINCGSHSGGFASQNLPALTNGNFLEAMCDAYGVSLTTHNTNAPNLPPPTNLVNQTVALGDNATFFITPNGLAPFTYQWISNSITLTNEANPTLLLTNVQLSAAGTYCVRVISSVMVTNLYCATLTVLTPPVFTNQPASQQFTNGQSITLTAGASGAGAFAYQWRANGANIIGATTSSYVITNGQYSDQGLYSVLIANPVRVIASGNALLKFTNSATVLADTFALRPAFTTASGLITGNSTNATREVGEPLHDNKFGSNSVWMQYAPPSSGALTLSTLGSAFDTLLAVYITTNGTVIPTNLVPVASNDDKDGKSFTSEVTFNVTGTTNYYVAVDGLSGARGPVILTWSLVSGAPALPRVTTQPADATMNLGSNATFSVTVSNANNSTYQWYYNDCLALAFATNSTLTVSDVAPANLGFYSVEITATNGQKIVSRHASLEIGPPGALSSDKLADLSFGQSGDFLLGNGRRKPLAGSFPSVTIGSLGSQIINTWNSTTDSGEPSHASTIGGSSRWYQLTAGSSATMIVDTIGSDYDTVLTIWTGTSIFSLARITSDNNGAPDGIRSKASFSAVSGTTYLIEVDGVASTAGNVYLNWKLGVAPAFSTPTTLYLNETNTPPTLNGGGTGANPAPTYQWQWNGANIAGATLSTYTLPTLQYSSGGTYSVVVSNLMGIVTNTISYISILAPLRIAKVTSNYRITGSFTQAMALQTSSNFLSWKSLTTNIDSRVGINYLDPAAPFRTNIFYRLKSP